jgi:periplasmic protein CpxP/Spy
MTLRPLRLALLAGLALPLGLATASLAQDGPPPPPPPAGGMHGEHHRDPAKMREHMAQHLRAALQLTPAQEPALAALLDSMKPPGDMKPRADGDRREESEHLSTPERLDKMLAHLDKEREHLAAHAAAVKTFYAQLTPSQQSAFDTLAPMMMHHGEGGHGDHHGGEGDHKMGPGGPPQG